MRGQVPNSDVQPSTHDAGFTLVELLVSLVLLGLVSLLMLDSLRMGSTTLMRGTALSNWIDNVSVIQNRLRDLLDNAYPAYVFSDGRGHVDFDGTSNALTFLAPTPIALGGQGRTRYNLLVEENGGYADLILTSRLELSASDSPATKRTLLSGVGSASFAYLALGSQNDAERWVEQWSLQRHLPQLIKIQVRFRPGDTRFWPEFVVNPQITLDVDCVYDSLTKRCRGR